MWNWVVFVVVVAPSVTGFYPHGCYLIVIPTVGPDYLFALVALPLDPVGLICPG